VVEVRRGGDADPLEQYVWDGRYVHSPCLRWRDGNTDGDLDDEGDSVLYYTNDANFNVTALVAADGDVAERVVYDPYGKPTFLKADWTLQEVAGHADGTASACANEILFTGHRRDAETGLYVTLYRTYHPTLGRWLQRDRIGYADGMNLCENAGGAPTFRRDAYGLDWAILGPTLRKEWRENAARGQKTDWLSDQLKAAWDWLTKSPTGCDAIQKWLDKYGDGATYGDPYGPGTAVTSPGASDPNMHWVAYSVERPPGRYALDAAGTAFGAREGVPGDKELADRAHDRPPGGSPVPEPTTARERQTAAREGAAEYAANQFVKQIDLFANTVHKGIFRGWRETATRLGLWTCRAGWYMNGTARMGSRGLSHGEAQQLLRQWCGIEAP